MIIIQLILVCFALAVDQIPIQVSLISQDPRSNLIGSLMGGYELRLQVIGLDQTVENNKIFVGDIPCIITDDGISGQNGLDGQLIRCITGQTNISQTFLPKLTTFPNSFQDNIISLPLIVQVFGKQNFNGNNVQQSVFATPILQNIIQNIVAPNNVINSQFAIKSYDPQYGVLYMGWEACVMNKILTAGNLFNYYCQVSKNMESGYYNVTIKGPSGLQYNRPESYQQSLDNQQQYQIMIVPKIVELSSNIASQNGQILKINGYGFSKDQNNIKISLSGYNIETKIMFANETQIIVELNNYENLDQTNFLQSSGLNYNKYNLNNTVYAGDCQKFRSQIQTNKSLVEQYLIQQNIEQSLEQYLNKDINYGDYYRGYFRPQKSGNYKFQISANSYAELYLSSISGFDVTNSIASLIYTNGQTFRNYAQLNQVSKEIQLVQDNYYLIEIYHCEFKIDGHLTVSIQIQDQNQQYSLYQPIPQRLLYSFTNISQINVQINNILAGCDEQICNYQLINNDKFLLQNFILDSDLLKLTVQSFSDVILKQSQITITFGGAQCQIISFTNNNNQYNFNCRLPSKDGSILCEAGDNLPIIDIYPIGKINNDPSLIPITQNIIVTQIIPPIGSIEGGTYLTILGQGFPFSNKQQSPFILTLGGLSVYPLYIDNQRINAITTPLQGSGELEIQFNGKTYTSATLFQYNQPNKIDIYSLSFLNQSPLFKGLLIIYATNLGTDANALNVKLENNQKSYQAPIVSLEGEQLTVYLRGGFPGDYFINIYKNGNEKSISVNQSNIFSYGVYISDIIPTQGSIYGGTIITIIGSNFIIEESIVFIGKELNNICEIDASLSNNTNIICITPEKPDLESYNKSVDVVVITRATLESQCQRQDGCKFYYSNYLTLKINDYPKGYNNISGIIQKPYTYDQSENLSSLTDISQPIKIILQDTIYKYTIDTTITDNNIISYQIPQIPQGNYITYVQTPDGYSDKAWYTIIPFTINEIQPNQISQGGQNIKLLGQGFNSQQGLYVQIGNYYCLELQIISNSLIQCRTPILQTGAQNVSLYQKDQSNDLIMSQIQVTVIEFQIELTSISQQSSLTINKNQINFIGDLTSPFQLQILGKNLNNSNDSLIYLQQLKTNIKFDGIVLNYSNQQIYVQFEQVPVGKYNIQLLSEGIFSTSSLIFYVQGKTQFSTQQVTNSSIMGGKIVQIDVDGTLIQNQLIKVNICGQYCNQLDIRETSIICTAPSLLGQNLIQKYPQVLQDFGKIDRELSKVSSSNGKDNSYFNLLFDQQDTTCIDLGIGGQSLTIEFESLIILELKSIQFTIQPSIDSSKSFIGTVFQYQLKDSTTWNNLFIIDQSVQIGLNIIIPESPIKNIKKIKILDQPNKSQLKICELQIIGRLSQSNLYPITQDYICGAVVIFNDFTFPVIQNVVQYQFSQTPLIQSVSNQYVPTFKMTDITLNGVGFGTDITQVTILLDNIICEVISVSETQIQCTTGIKDLTTNNLQGQFIVQINQNIAINQQIVQYGNLWSDIETWGGYVFPNDDETVVVKQGQILILDIQTPKLKSVFIEGTLIFQDNGKQIILDTQQLIINQGKLLIGEQNNPYLSQAQIILRGEYNDTQLIEYGNKVLGCNQCTIKLYGNSKLPAWTLLNKTIEIGDTQLLLDETVNWNIGDQIIITSSDFDYKQSEVKTIVDILDNLIKVDQPFIYQHYSAIEQYGDQLFNNKVEVGVLTRNIQIIGDQSKIQKYYGYHFKILGQSNIQIAYTEFINGGQIQYQGRHSIYFKQNNNLNGGYLIGNSIHNNNARCIVLNQAKYLQIQNNICFNTQGHSILLLSGLETNNQITNNLIINTMANYFLLQSDIQPSSFLITNPINSITGNRAAGSDYDGFKFDFTQNADYLGQDCRSGTQIKQFQNNQAHSTQFSGLHIPIHLPRDQPCQPISDPCRLEIYQISLKQYLKGFNTWNNNLYGIFLFNVGNIELYGIQVINSRISIYIQQTNLQEEPVIVNNALLVRYSKGSYFQFCYAFILPRTEKCNLLNINLYNYIVEDTIFRIDSGNQPYTSIISVNYQISNVKINNVTAKFVDDTFTNSMIWDQNGSFFTDPSYIFPKNLYISTESCQNSNSIQWKNIIYCPQSVQMRSFHAYAMSNPSDTFFITNEFNPNTTFDNQNQKGLILKTGQSYYIQNPIFNGILKKLLWMNIMLSNYYVQSDKSIVFRWNTQQQISSVIIQINNENCVSSGYPVGSLNGPPDPASCTTGQWFYKATTNDFYLCIQGKIHGYIKRNERINLIFKFIVGQEFPLPPPVVPNNQTNNTTNSTSTNSSTDNSSTSNTSNNNNQNPVWSNPNMWPSKQIPLESENVTIQKGLSLILDIDPPYLYELIIYGSIIFDDKRNSSILKANKLWIQEGGQIIAGNSTNPYKGLITIYINGDSKEQSIIVSGLMSLYGLVPSTRFSRLTEFSSSGQNTIKVESANGWEIGDIVVIGPTESDPLQDEEFVISQIQDKVITLSKPLLYNHYGDNELTLIQQDIGQFDMRAIIINLSRNIKIKSQNSSYQLTVQYLENSTLKNGLILNGVEISQCKVLEILSNFNNSVQIDGSTFHHSDGQFIKSINTSNISISNTIFYQGLGQLVQLNNIKNLVFKNNVLMNAISTKGLLANFIYDTNIEITTDIVQVSDNIGIGSQNSGFLFMTSSCKNQNKLSFFNNSCSNNMNTCISYRQSDGSCDIIGQNFASQSQIGILAQLQTKQIQIKQLILIENKINLITMMGTEEILNNSIFLSNSFISPQLRENCTQCYDNNLSTHCQDTVGIQMATISKNVNPPSFEKFDSDVKLESAIAVDGRVYIDSVIFKGFKSNYSDESVCANNSVFRQHPQADDMTPQHYLTNTKCLNCTQEGLLYNLRPTNLGLVGSLGGCGTFECTGQINILIEDQDGSFFGQLGQAIGNNQYFGPSSQNCKKVNDWVGYFCKNNSISVLNFMSTALDFNTRLYSPVTLTDGQFKNQINSYKEWQWNNNQPLNKRESKFVSLAKINAWINMTNQGQNPTESIYWLSKRKYNGSPSDYLIIQLQFESKNIIQVSVNGTIIKAGISQQDSHWNLSQKIDSCGANNYFNNNNTIHFVVTGELNCLVKISLLNTIQITSRISITKAQFLGKNFLQYASAQLGGDPYNYFIVSITKVTQKRNLQTSDSIYDIKWAIVDPIPIGVEEQTQVNDRLTVLQNKINTIVSDSNSDYKIVSSNTSVSIVDIQTLSNPKPVETTTPPVTNNTKEQNNQTNNQTSNQTNSNNQQDVNLPPIKDSSQNQQSNDYIFPYQTNKSSTQVNETSQSNLPNTPQQNNEGQTLVDQLPKNSSDTPQNKIQQNSTVIDIEKSQGSSNNPIYITIFAIIIPFIILLILFIGYVCYRRRKSRKYSIVASMKFDIPSMKLDVPSMNQTSKHD